MELFLLLIRLVLAGLFGIAGVAKFADLKGSEKAFKEFGVPRSLALPASITLSVVEIGLAVMFLFPETSWYAAIGAAGLLALFILQMVYQRAKGNAPDCHCFGQLHSEPVSIKSIARNVVFLALTAIPLVRGPGGQGLALQQVTSDMMPILLGALAVIMLGGALAYLRRIVAMQVELRRRLDVLEVVASEGAAVDHQHATDPSTGLPIGAPLPPLELKALDGKTVTRVELTGNGKPLMFFFVSPTCEPCQALLPEFRSWQKALENEVRIFFVSSGSAKDNAEKFAELDPSSILLDGDRRFALSVGGRWTPTALYVDSEGKIGSHIAAGDFAIEELVERIRKADLAKPYTFFANGDHHGRGLKIGVEAPEFSFTDIEGREIRKGHLLGKRTLFAFWSPTCPHCTNFLDEFKQWERSRSNGDLNVILISDGDIDEHRELGFDAPVVLDKGYKTAAKLGMFGTPSAVLLNQDGVIQSETAVGASNIWALLGRTDETN